MSIGKWIFKKEVKKLAAKIIDSEGEIDAVVHRFLTGISFGQILGLLARKLVGLLK